MGRPSDARERLIRAAIRTIFAQSFASASVDELCQQADVGKGSFYHFFPTKLDLALAALDHYWASLRRRVVEPALQPDLPPLQRLVRLVDLIAAGQSIIFATLQHMTGCLIGNLTLEMSVSSEPMRCKVVAIFTEWQADIEATLREAQAEGELPGVNCALAAQAVLAYIEGLVLLAKSQNAPHLIAQLGSGVLALAQLGAS